MKKIKRKIIKNCLAMITVLALLFPQYIINRAKAADVTSRKDVIADSRPSTRANHTISFTLTASNAVDEGDTLTLTFDSAFDTSSVTEDEVDITDDGVDLTTAANCAGAEQASVAMAADVLTITICAGDGGAIAASSAVVIEIGANATASGTGVANNRIQNPALSACTGASSVCGITIGGTFGDAGDMKVAIISGVTVSATIDETLTFSVNAVTTGNCPDFDNTAGNEVGTTATTVPYSTISTETFYDACQDLRVGTNASGGYSVTVQETDQLTSGANQIADGTCDGACSDSAENQWATASNNGFGYCMDDQATFGDGSATADAGWGTNGCDDADTYFKTIADAGASETAQAIMSSATGVSDDRSFVGLRLTADAAQAAGTYTTTIVYIATPTY